MSDRQNSIPTPVDRARDAMTLGVLVLAAGRGILMHAADLVRPTDSAQLARMEAREIPWDLPASLWRDLDHAIGYKLEEAMAEIESALGNR